MDDAQFHRAMIVTLLVGSAIVGIGATVLLIAFRKFGGPKAGRPAHMALMFGLVVFVLTCCALLFRYF
jgi:hypothetical protein